MFDLDRGIVGDVRVLGVKGPNEPQGVRWAVQEIRIAERNVLRASRYLLRDVGKHNIDRDDSEAALVHRNDWAMTAKMLAAT